MNEDWSALANDLEKYINKDITGNEFISRWKIASPEILKILYNINHLLADEDIRQTSASYKLMQENEARKLINHLRQRSNIEDILRIGFLKKTDIS